RLFDSRPLWMKIVAALLLSLPVALGTVQSNQLIFADLQEQVNREIASRESQGGGSEFLDEMPTFPEGEFAESRLIYVSQWQDFADIFFGRYFMMLAWSALYLALLTGEKARMAERREGEYRRAAKAAELRSLRYQVNPH